MTSASGYYPYLDLVQTYSVDDLRYVPSPLQTYFPNSISGFLQRTNDFRIFLYLLKIAKLDGLANQSQFKSTLFVCPDSILKQQFGEDFFMNLDRDSALKIITFHILPYKVNMETFRKQKLTILKTKNESSLITLINNGDGFPICLNGATSSISPNKAHIISNELALDNGMVYVIDTCLLPESF
jgi:uncharacterized surface protein with fasciclin (FAS1) repeats